MHNFSPIFPPAPIIEMQSFLQRNSTESVPGTKKKYETSPSEDVWFFEVLQDFFSERKNEVEKLSQVLDECIVSLKNLPR